MKSLIKIVIGWSAALLFLSTSVAETIVWTGLGDGSSFDDGANWSLGVAPTSADHWIAAGAALVLESDQGGLSVGGRSDLINSTLTIHGGQITAINSYWSGLTEFNMTGGYYGTAWWETGAINNLSVNLSGTAYLDNNLNFGGYLYSPSGGMTIGDDATIESWHGIYFNNSAGLDPLITQDGGTVFTNPSGAYGLHFGASDINGGGVYDLNSGTLRLGVAPQGGSGQTHRLELAPGAVLQVFGDWTADPTFASRDAGNAYVFADGGLPLAVDYDETLLGYTTISVVPEPSSNCLVLLTAVSLCLMARNARADLAGREHTRFAD